MKNFNDIPPSSYTTNNISGVGVDGIMGVGFSSWYTPTVAKNQWYHSLAIIFSAHQQNIAFSKKYGTYLLFVLSLVDQTQWQPMGKLYKYFYVLIQFIGVLQQSFILKKRHQNTLHYKAEIISLHSALFFVEQ